MTFVDPFVYLLLLLTILSYRKIYGESGKEIAHGQFVIAYPEYASRM